MKMSDQQLPDYTFNLFQIHAMRTAKDMGPEADLMHATLGLVSEAGEFADAIKKSYAYDKELDVENLIEEIGDIMWFCALAARSLGVPMEQPALRCIEKLMKRYPDKFSNEAAHERADKQAE
jgi:NTP pyrophosphatase (non-canonical NTP hydrolase)